MPEFKVYEDERESTGTQIRLAAGFLWLWVNTALLYTKRDTRRWDDSCRSWGFYFMDRVEFIWRWGNLYCSFGIPFITTVHIKSEVLSLDRKRVVHVCGKKFMDDYESKKKAETENTGTFNYAYTLLNGEQQKVQAAVTVERWTGRYKWTPFRKVRDSIWVNFSEEVGPERGSWKGGVTGCGWNLLPNESVVECLQRMECTRRFER